MVADYSDVSDAIKLNQFSGEMVMALFCMIIIIIIDRHLNRGKKFEAVGG